MPVWIVVGIALMSGSAAAEPAVRPPTPLTLEWCIERAAQANPEIAENVAALDSSRERIRPAGALEDPRIAYEASNLPTGDFNFASTPLSGHQFGLKQRFPFPGLLRSREEAARAGSEAARSDLADRMRRIAGAAEDRWATLGFAQRALDITNQNIDLVRQLSKIAEVKYRVGAGLQQDVLRAQVALTRLLEEQLRRRAALDVAASSLAAVLDLPYEVFFPRTSALEDEAPLPDLEILMAELEAKSPVLEAARERIAQAEQEVEAARFAGYPDFDLGIGYRVRKSTPGDPVNGDDFLSAGVTVRLPVDRAKWRSRVAERRALVRRAEATYRRSRAELRAGLRSIHARLVQADREQELLETGLVPQAKQSLASSRSGYEVGRVDFLSLLDSQVRLLDAELQRERAVADRRSAYAALEATIGEELR